MRVAIYARVSTDRGEQNPDIQIEELRRWLAASGHEIAGAPYVDRLSGASTARPSLDALTADVEAHRFDAVAIVKLDRLARSVSHLTQLAAFFADHGVDLLVKDQAIDTSTPAGKLLFHVLAAIAEFERDLIIERTRSGISYAAEHGTRSGRPHGRPRREIDLGRVAELLGELGSITAVAKTLAIPRRTLSAALAREAA